MKNLARLSTLLAVTAIAGHGALWYTASAKLEDKLIGWLESPTESEGSTVDYKVEKFGYPLSIGFKIPHYNIKTVGNEAIGTADTEIKMAGNFKVFANLFTPSRYIVTLDDSTVDFINPNNLQVQQAKVLIGHAETHGSTFNKQPDNLTIQNLSLIQMDGQKSQTVATLEKLNSTATKTEVSPNTFNNDWNVNISNIVLNNPEDPNKNLTIETFNTQAQSINWPSDKGLSKAIEDAQAKAEAEGSASTAQIKEQMSTFVTEMGEKNSQFILNELTIQGDKATLNMDADLKVLENTQVDGVININLQGVQSLAAFTGNNTIASNPILQQFITDEDSLKFDLKAENGLLMVGGKIFAPIPPISALLQGIPPYIHKNDTF